MGKTVFIAEKPSVAESFAKALKLNTAKRDGYLEANNTIVTWCYGHLVTMSYPDAYDEKYKKWRMETLPFIPKEYKYEVIPSAAKQFKIVSGLLNRADVDAIYVCTDSGREGEYIYRLVDRMAKVPDTKDKRRVWIDSQTDEEIRRGIREAKPLHAYDHLADAAYLRAKEDYLMGINFSRVLTLQYGGTISSVSHARYTVISVGRVMTCVLGMVVRREREIRSFVKTPFFRILAKVPLGEESLEGEWRAVEGSRYYKSPKLYKENGFLRREDAQAAMENMTQTFPLPAQITELSKKKEKKNPPLLFNLAEIQNECSKRYKITPDQTLQVIQTLYERRLVTYPRTDARVLSTAVAKEIDRNIKGLLSYAPAAGFAKAVLDQQAYKGLEKTRYVDDKKITDHYALVPTGQGLQNLGRLGKLHQDVYDLIVRRFLSIFYPAAEYTKVSMTAKAGTESFFFSARFLTKEGYLTVASDDNKERPGQGLLEQLSKLRKGQMVQIESLSIKEGETTPPKRYTSGSMILAMENAGQLIEDEGLREQIKGAGIGTSATRAEILKKLVNIRYLELNKKTQVLFPTHLGEMVHDTAAASIRSLLNPELTASWEKGLSYVAEGSVTPDEYMEKLEKFITSRTEGVKGLRNQYALRQQFLATEKYYPGSSHPSTGASRSSGANRSSSRSGRSSSGTRRASSRNGNKK